MFTVASESCCASRELSPSRLRRRPAAEPATFELQPARDVNVSGLGGVDVREIYFEAAADMFSGDPG
jgi:hypothetical protein